MAEVVIFGRWLKERRRDLDLTQDTLAERVGCSGDTIRKLEAGLRRPYSRVADRLAVALGLSPPDRPAFVEWARGSKHPPAPGAPVLPSGDPPPPPAPPSAPAPPARSPLSLPRPLTPLIG